MDSLEEAKSGVSKSNMHMPLAFHVGNLLPVQPTVAQRVGSVTCPLHNLKRTSSFSADGPLETYQRAAQTGLCQTSSCWRRAYPRKSMSAVRSVCSGSHLVTKRASFAITLDQPRNRVATMLSWSGLPSNFPNHLYRSCDYGHTLDVSVS